MVALDDELIAGLRDRPAWREQQPDGSMTGEQLESACIGRASRRSTTASLPRSPANLTGLAPSATLQICETFTDLPPRVLVRSHMTISTLLARPRGPAAPVAPAGPCGPAAPVLPV
ncbi:MAG: hypothetical protein ACYCX7_10030, partial [Solirubrobacteraceae bacterium]